MFEVLRKKLSSFSGKIASTAQKKEVQEKEKRDLSPETTKTTKIKSVLKKEILLTENDLKDSLSELELALLEADINEETAKSFCETIKQKLKSKPVPSKEIKEFVNQTIRQTLLELMQQEPVDLFNAIKNKKPFTILFLGPNGAGKTTSMAKLAVLLKEHGYSSLFAAADTFRAASIEQLQEHANNTGTRLIKHKYGADPAAVCFDAVNAAKSSGTDIVIIDSAGRQETNKNLIEELKKITRVSKPDLKIFVGEAFAGKGLVKQAKDFDQAIGIDCFIITKLDTDAKGGAIPSLLHELKKPILFIGTGQNYSDLMPFKAEEIINRII